MPTLVSVNVSAVKTMRLREREVRTSLLKEPVSGPVAVGALGLAGDARVEPRGFGAEHHAVYAYATAHYAYWERRLERAPLPRGVFGENLTVDGALDTEIRIGDIVRCGAVTLQVAQPRIPCAKLKHRLGLRSASDFLSSLRTGYYLRVLEEGTLAAGDAFEVVDSDDDSPTVAEVVRLSEVDYWDNEGLKRLLRARDLIDGWKHKIGDKVRRAETAFGWAGFRELTVVERHVERGEATFALRCSSGRALPELPAATPLTFQVRLQEGASRARVRGALRVVASGGYRVVVPRSAGDEASAHLIDLLGFGDSVRVAVQQPGRPRVPALAPREGGGDV